MLSTKDSLTAIISGAIHARDRGFAMAKDGLYSLINALDAIVVIDRHTNRIIRSDMKDTVFQLRIERDAKYGDVSTYLRTMGVVPVAIQERLVEINRELDRIAYQAIEELYDDLWA